MALDRDTKLASYATHDASESLPKIIKFLEAIGAENEKKLLIIVQKKTEKDLTKEIKNYNSKTLFQKAKKDIESTFDSFMGSHKTIDDVTELDTAELFHGCTDAVLEYLKLDLGENKHGDELFEHLMTDIFLQYALLIYKLADERNKASFFSRTKLAFKNEHDFLKPYELLIHGIRYIHVAAETVELWEEIALWLEAQYTFRHNLMPKNDKGDVQLDEHGKYMPVVSDADDVDFKKHKSICKYDIELRNFTISKMIAVSIDKYRNTLASPQSTKALKLETIQTVETSEPPDAISLSTPQSNKDSEEDFEFIPLTPISQTQLKPRSSNNISLIESEGSTQIIITLNSHELEKISQITAAATAILDQNLLAVGDEVIPKEFANVEKNTQATDDDRITKLRFCAKKYLLTSLQNAALEYLSDDIESSFKQYKNEKTTFIFAKKHTGLVEQFLLNLPTMSPQMQLLELIKLRKKLADDSSDKLLDRVNKLLLKAYRTLSINHALALQEDVVVAHRKKSHSHHQ